MAATFFSQLSLLQSNNLSPSSLSPRISQSLASRVKPSSLGGWPITIHSCRFSWWVCSDAKFWFLMAGLVSVSKRVSGVVTNAALNALETNSDFPISAKKSINNPIVVIDNYDSFTYNLCQVGSLTLFFLSFFLNGDCVVLWFFLCVCLFLWWNLRNCGGLNPFLISCWIPSRCWLFSGFIYNLFEFHFFFVCVICWLVLKIFFFNFFRA